MHHQHRHLGAAQHVMGKAAEDPFAHPAVAVGAHDDECTFFGSGRKQGFGGALPVRVLAEPLLAAS